MASGITNKGAFHFQTLALSNATEPTNYYIALCTSAVTPDVDTNTLSQLTQVTAGGGYTDGGLIIARTIAGAGLDWASITEDDTDNRSEAILENVVWTATATGITGARWAVLTDDNGTVGSRLVLAWWDLSSDRSVTDTQTLTLTGCELRITPA